MNFAGPAANMPGRSPMNRRCSAIRFDAPSASMFPMRYGASKWRHSARCSLYKPLMIRIASETSIFALRACSTSPARGRARPEDAWRPKPLGRVRTLIADESRPRRTGGGELLVEVACLPPLRVARWSAARPQEPWLDCGRRRVRGRPHIERG